MCLVLVLGLVSTSCITQKDVVYLQDKGTVINDSLQLQALASPYRVQVNDLLSVNVKAEKKEVSDLVQIFNPTTNEIGNSDQSLYYDGFTVDLHGNIEFPILGEINVLGFTTDEVEEKIKTYKNT